MRGTEDGELLEKLIEELMENWGMSREEAEWEITKLIGVERNVQLLKGISPGPQRSMTLRYETSYNRAERRKKICSSPRYTQKKKGRKKK